MLKPITAYGFRGMNNLPGMPAKLLDDERRISPALVLNSVVTDGGHIQERTGYAAQKALTACHSLWGGSVMLCVSNNTLYRIDGAETTALATLAGVRTPLCYVEVNNLVYISSLYWDGAYDLLRGAIRSWGLATPPAPDIALVTDGELPPGRYTACFTRMVDGRLSGNGPLTQVVWEGGAHGVRFRNLPSDGQAWITQPNGQKLFLAALDGDTAIHQVPDAALLPSFMVTLPPKFAHFCQAFGRIWGANSNYLYYSEPFQYEWFKSENRLTFLEELIMVAPVENGLFVNSRNSTWFLDGGNPGEMSVNRIGDGAIPQSLVYAQMPGAVVGGGYEISRRLSQLPSPVWTGRNGIVVGTHSGHLVHLTEARLNFNPRSQGGAGLYYVKDGVPRIITTLWGVRLKPENDELLDQVFEYGQLYPGSSAFEGGGYLSLEGSGGLG